MTNHIIPVQTDICVQTQTFAEHVKYARDNNLTDYSGGSDWAPYTAYVDRDIPVHPSAEIKITEAGWNKKNDPIFGYGVCIRGDCGDGDLIVLGHLRDGTLGYSVGAIVKPSDTIGLMGWTGNVRPHTKYGTHLHWGVKRNGVYIDPMSVLGTPTTIIQLEPQPATTEFVLPKFPCKVKVSDIVTETLALRWFPIQGKDLMRLEKGTILNAYTSIKCYNDYWYLVTDGVNRAGWSAAYYLGEIFLEEVK